MNKQIEQLIKLLTILIYLVGGSLLIRIVGMLLAIGSQL